MYLSDRFLKIALLGMGHDPEDIVEYIAECSSVTGSFLLGIAATICTLKFVGTWLAPIAGLGAYALGIAFGCSVFLQDHTKG